MNCVFLYFLYYYVVRFVTFHCIYISNCFVVTILNKRINYYNCSLLLFTMSIHRSQGSSPGCALFHSGVGQTTYTCVPLYNLVPAKRVISLAGKVTTGLVESNGSLPLGMTNVTCRLTAKKPGSAPCPTLVIEYGTTLLMSTTCQMASDGLDCDLLLSSYWKKFSLVSHLKSNQSSLVLFQC